MFGQGWSSSRKPYRRSTVLLAAVLFVSLTGWAAEPPAPAEKKPEPEKKVEETKPAQEIVVTAERLPTPREATGVSVNTIGAAQTQVNQDISAAEALRMVPGVVVNQSGRRGDQSSLFIRGGNSDTTAVLYDGWKVNKSGWGRSFNFESLDPIGLDRIEVARGPASSLYGSEAVTGAVNVLTKKGEGRPELTTSVAGGTYGTDRETAGIQGREKGFSYNLNSARLNREQASVINSRLETYNYSARLDYDISEDHTVKFVARGVEFQKGFYENTFSGWGPTVAPPDPNDHLRNRDLLTGLEYTGRVVPIWETVARVGRYDLDLHVLSRLPNPSDPKAFDMAQLPSRQDADDRRYMGEWRNHVTAFESRNIKDIVTVGFYGENEAFEQRDTSLFFANNIDQAQNNWSVYVQNRLELYKRAFLTLGGRHEENEQFGGFDTGRADLSILIPESDSRVYGSVGNAFRAPSFFELYSPNSGNKNLQPEQNFAYDVGFEQTFWKKRIVLSVTYFQNHFKDRIGFAFVFPTYQSMNLGREETHGWEYQAAFRPLQQLSLEGNATQLHTSGKDSVLGDELYHRLRRRPVWTHTGRLLVHPLLTLVPAKWAGLDLSFEVLHVSPRVDIGPTELNYFGERVRNPGYIKADFAASYKFFDHWRAFVRVENFTDTKYQDVRTFPTDGSNVLGGVEFKWRF